MYLREASCQLSTTRYLEVPVEVVMKVAPKRILIMNKVALIREAFLGTTAL